MSFGFANEKQKTKSKESFEKTAEQTANEDLQQTGATTGTTINNALTTGTTVGTGTTSQTGTTQGTTAQQSTQRQNSQTGPWSAAQPYIEQFLGQLGGLAPQAGQLTDGQQSAVGQLRQGMQTGPVNPYGTQTDGLVNDLFGAESRAPRVDDAFAAYDRRLSPTANGQNMDFDSNPVFQSMLDKAGRDARTAASETFAGAGRSFSPSHARAAAEGVSDAQLPFLFNQYNMEQGRTDQATRDLFTGATGAATTAGGLDQQSAALRAMGIDVAQGGFGLGDRAYAQGQQGATDQLNLETMLRNVGIDDVSKLGPLLYGAAGLGQTSTADVLASMAGQTGQTSNQTGTTTEAQTSQQQQQQIQQQQIEELIRKILSSEQTGSERGTGTSSGTNKTSGFSASAKLF